MSNKDSELRKEFFEKSASLFGRVHSASAANKELFEFVEQKLAEAYNQGLEDAFVNKGNDIAARNARIIKNRNPQRIVGVFRAGPWGPNIDWDDWQKRIKK